MKRIKFVHALVVVITGWFFLTTWCLPTAAANKANNNQPARSFTVKAVISHNQIDKKLTYYDLQVHPQQKQTLKMVVTNLGTKKLKVDLNINNAYTSQNGIISYDKSYVHLYKAQQPALSDLVQGKRHKSIVIDPQQSQTVKFTYQAPKTSFRGIILGGITASAAVGNSRKKNLTIQNRIRYVTGVVLRSQSHKVNPHLTLGANVRAQSRNMQSGLNFELRNAQPINLSKMKLRVRITPKTKNMPLRKLNNMQMAPNSTWQVFVPYKKLTAGTYVLHLNVKEKPGWEQNFTRKFTITKSQENTLSKEKTARNWPILTWILLIVVLGIVLVIGYLLWVYLQGNKRN